MTTNDDAIGTGAEEAGCGHPACACAAGPSGYCSAECEARSDSDDENERESCPCGHADCEAEIFDASDTGT
ncbi:MAG: hypothetical protein U1E86_27755 [Burkholderiaceae bacterium]